MNKNIFNKLVVGDIVKDASGKYHTIKSVERFSKSPKVKKTYSFTDTENNRCIENDEDVKGLKLVGVNFSIMINELLPDYGSYFHDVENCTGRNISPDDIVDVLNDFANWDNLQLVDANEIDMRSNMLADAYFGKGVCA